MVCDRKNNGWRSKWSFIQQSAHTQINPFLFWSGIIFICIRVYLDGVVFIWTVILLKCILIFLKINMIYYMYNLIYKIIIIHLINHTLAICSHNNVYEYFHLQRWGKYSMSGYTSWFLNLIKTTEQWNS